MKRITAVLGLALGVLAIGAGGAYAQSAACGGYHEPACPTTTAPTTTAPTTTAPPPPVTPATTSTTTATPGEPLTITSPTGVSTLEPGTTAQAGIARGNAAAVPQILASAEVNDDGSVSITFNIPSNTPTGVYYAFIIATGADGSELVFIAPIAVSNDGVASSGEPSALNFDAASTGTGGGSSAAATGASSQHAPQALIAVQQANTFTAEEEGEVVAAAASGATLGLLDDGRLIVNGVVPGTAGTTDSGLNPLLAAAAIAAAGAGVMLLRRRTSTIASKG